MASLTITDEVWTKYIDALRTVNDKAASEMFSYLSNHEWWKSVTAKNEAIEYAFGLATKYGEAAAELACEMYQGIIDASMVSFPSPEPAPTASMQEVARAVNGTMKTENPRIISDAVGRLVKMAGADTTLKNAERDGAQWAWVPHGDTCAFCLMLASRGWQRGSGRENGHAAHIHANCDCTYAVRFNSRTKVEGYNDGKEFREFYDYTYDEDGNRIPRPGNWENKLNAMRRDIYAANKANGLPKQLLNSSVAEELDVK